MLSFYGMRKFLQIARYLILAGIFFIPFTPLIVSKSLFFPFITGKNFFFRIIVEIIFGLWVILAAYDKRYRPQRSWLFCFLAAFVFISLLSTIFGVNPYRSFWSNYERMEGLLAHLHILAYFVVLISALKTEKLWKYFFHVSLGVAAIIGIYGLLQIGGKLAIHQSDNRLDATLGNASYLAVYMLFHFFLAALYFFKEKEWYRWFYVPLATLYALIMYYTATRGTILGFVGGVILAAILAVFSSEDKRVKKSSFVFLAIAAALLFGFYFARNSNFIKNSLVLSRFSNISLEETTTQSRFVIWKMSWEGFKERPILGWGPENYNILFNKYYEPVLWKQEPWFDRAHNVFFDRLTTNGIFGLLAYLGLFGSATYYLLFRRKRFGFSVAESSILVSLLAAYFFHNLFVFDNIVSFILFFAVLACVHFRATSGGEDSNEYLTDDADNYKKHFLVSVAVIAVTFSIYYVNVPAMLTANNLLGAFEETSQKNIKGAFDKFEKALSYNSFGTTETREHLSNFAGQVYSAPSLEQDFKDKVFQRTVSEMENQIERFPNDVRYLIFLASLYNKGGQYDKAIELEEKAINLSPKKQQLYFELGGSHISKGEYGRATNVLKTAFEFDPTYDEARIIYAISLVYSGNIDSADKLLEERFGTFLIADRRLVNAYSFAGRSERLAPVWEGIVKENPNNPQYRVSLAAAFMKISERAKAIEQLEAAIELEPNFKQQGEYYINEIKAGRNP